MTRTAVLICPGRGTYNAPELGYLARHFPDPGLLAGFEAVRARDGQAALADLDGSARYDAALHTRGDVASPLIFATMGDWVTRQMKGKSLFIPKYRKAFGR